MHRPSTDGCERYQDRGGHSTCRMRDRNSRRISWNRRNSKDKEDSFETDGLVDRLVPSILSPCWNTILNPAVDNRMSASPLERDARLISMFIEERTVSKQFPMRLLTQSVFQIAPASCPPPSKLLSDGMHELRPRMPQKTPMGSKGISLHALRCGRRMEKNRLKFVLVELCRRRHRLPLLQRFRRVMSKHWDGKHWHS